MKLDSFIQIYLFVPRTALRNFATVVVPMVARTLLIGLAGPNSMELAVEAGAYRLCPKLAPSITDLLKNMNHFFFEERKALLVRYSRSRFKLLKPPNWGFCNLDIFSYKKNLEIGL